MKFKSTWLFETFDKAMNVHLRIFAMLRERGFVTYADLSRLADNVNNKNKVYPIEYEEYGWTNLFGLKVELFGFYWGFEMPEVEKLKKESN